MWKDGLILALGSPDSDQYWIENLCIGLNSSAKAYRFKDYYLQVVGGLPRPEFVISRFNAKYEHWIKKLDEEVQELDPDDLIEVSADVKSDI